MADGEGVDVSSWQGAIDFHKVKAAGKNYVIIRGGDGRYRDPMRHVYREGSAQAGLERDSYHYLRWRIPAAEMAAICEESVGVIGVPHIWSDAEDTSAEFKAIPLQGRIDWLGEVLDRITGKGIKTDIYTGPWWWKGWLGNTTRFSQYRLWSAEYPFNNSLQAYNWLVRPTLCGGWSKVSIWQYSSTGHVPGVTSVNTDLNWAFEPLYPQQHQPPQEDYSNMPDPIFYVENPPDGKYRAGQMSAAGFHAHGVPWIVDKLVEGGARKVPITIGEYDLLVAGVNIREITGGYVTEEKWNELMAAIQATGGGAIPQPVLDAIDEINVQLQNPPLAAIAKAVADEQARRQQA